MKQRLLINSKLSWYDEQGVALSGHAKSQGIPEGGNFLYEDGHIKWFKNTEVGLGSIPSQKWRCYYDIVKKFKPLD